MTALSYFPVVEDQEQLIDLLSRAAWFLSFCPIDRIYIPVSAEELQHVPWRVAPGLDDSIESKFAALRKKVTFVVVKKESDLAPCMTRATIILRWKKDSIPDFVSANSVTAWQKGKKVWQVDPVAERMEGSHYIEVGLHLLQDREALIQENKAKFEQMARKLGTFKRAYLMATGPSISRYKLFDYTDALSIVCNSVILDEELMGTVRPQILVFADPIFHFGPSQYTAAFRAKLRESAKKHDFMICIPFKYYAIFTEAMPELKDRTIAIPFLKDTPFNFNLSQRFEVRTTANILTLLMTPIAASFTDEIGYLGCDGRPLTENNYFWSHNQNTQFNDKMANIRTVHPGFFAIDYNDYYLEHCTTLEKQLDEGEAKGKTFISLGFSHIPALKGRLRRGCRMMDSEREATPGTLAIIIDPDGKDWRGHYLAHNDKLSNALTNLDAEVKVICRKDLEETILASHPNYIPRLTAHSWEVGNTDYYSRPQRTFEAEVESVLAEVQSSYRTIVVYMSGGSVEHGMSLSRLTRAYPNVYVNINLFWMSFRISRERVEGWRAFLEWLDFSGHRFKASVPTAELQSELAELSGCILDVAPYPSTGFSDEDIRRLGENRVQTGKDHGVTVLFPGTLRPETGYNSSLQSAVELIENHGFRAIIRSGADSLRTKLSPEDLCRPENLTIITGDLTDQEFFTLFEHSDVVVLPYSRAAFAKRISGRLVDALCHRRPVVVLEGTWLATVVRAYGCGVVLPDDEPQTLIAGLMEILNAREKYQQAADLAAKNYFAVNSWENFGRFLLGVSKAEKMVIAKASRPVRSVIGPYAREYGVHRDETNCIAKL